MGQFPDSEALTRGAETLAEVSVLRCRDGQRTVSADVLAVEVPVALEYNGISHVVMLASPNDLEDFALGFSLTEGIIAQPSELYDVEVERRDDGLLVHLQIASERFVALKARRRNMTGRTGCGLCGTEALDQVRRVVEPVTHRQHFADHQLMAGMRAMQALQPLQQQSGATHAAAWMDAQGQVVLVREDVGRHNALDKLIGALVTRQTDLRTGALLITSRASYEMVQKAAIMHIGLVAAISAPTSFAVSLAESTGVTLIGFMRDHSYVIYTHPERLES
ncbi:MAG: formate dehydrogenase accessory sulfurtransferase FdhD [Oxalobacteraceae bacterium]|jgi:FdhD protein|nr:formate dehydrogenase accessory sulfurtransferase FdhD [Oxalobacteraceae bacterium]